MAQPTQIQMHHYLLTKFFGVADSPADDVNPYDSVGVFRRSTIASLRWGNTDETRSASKKRCAENLEKVVALDSVELAERDIQAGLDRDAARIDDVVFEWAGKATLRE